jgi:hypothetical protein
MQDRARRYSLAIGLLAAVAITVTTAATAASGSVTVRSSLDGKTVLPHRIAWIARPSLPPGQIKEVDYLIDGKVRWIEQHAPYNYGDDGEALVTSWLSPGRHRFAVRAVANSGQAATDMVTARVIAAPAPPASLAGSWQRSVDTSMIGPLPSGVEQPAGTYRLTLDRRWIQSRFPGAFVAGSGPNSSEHTGHGWLIDSDWSATAGTLRVDGSVSFRVLHPTDQEGGWWCGPGVGAATYRWSISGSTLTLTPVGHDSCKLRRIIWAAEWSRAS